MSVIDRQLVEFIHRETGRVGGRHHAAHDGPPGGRREKESDVQSPDERHQFGGVGVSHERRPVLRQPRQLDQERRIPAERLGRGEFVVGRVLSRNTSVLQSVRNGDRTAFGIKNCKKL